MTDCAASRVDVASSTVPWLYWGLRGSIAPDVAALASPVPNAPKSTLAKERFIALLIIMERMKPLVPSSAPAMIRTLLLMANPVALEERPAYEFRSEITTGMSAPPMGMTAV